MTDLNKSLTDSFYKIKDLLPRGYQKTIAEKLEGIGVEEVRKAFNGRLKNRQKLLQILSEANKLVKSIAKENEMVTSKVAETVIALKKLD